MATEVRHCRSCGAPVHWLRHCETGKLAPIDADRAPDGKWAVSLHDGVYMPAEQFTLSRHHNHFATCPSAGEHRR